MSEARAILVIDDDDAFCTEVTDALRAEGFVAVRADTVEDAAALLRSTDFSLILLDLVLRDGEDGFAVFELLRASRADIPVIVMSQHVRRYVLELANFFSPVTVIINKPCPAEQVVAHVSAALNPPSAAVVH